MSWARTGAFALIASAVLLACTFTRSLDYLQEGQTVPEGGASTSSSSSSGTTSGSSASTDDTFNPDLPPAGDVLASEQLNPASLLQDADNLYWVTEDNKVMKVAKAGGAAKQLTALPGVERSQISTMTIDPSPGGNLYLVIAGTVKTLSREGGAPADFLPAPVGASIYEILADDTSLFVLGATDEDDTAVLTRYPKGNAAGGVVLSRPASAGDTGPGALATFGNDIYWSTYDINGVQVLHELPKTAASGTPPVTTWKNTGRNADKEPAGVNALNGFELAIDQDAIYWVDSSYFLPYRLARSSPVAETAPLFGEKVASALSVTVDAQTIYVLAKDRIVALQKSDTGKRVHINSEKTGTMILGDDKALYYVFLGSDSAKASGGIRRVKK